jgi:mitochondrial chaperone BCS1
MFNALKNLLSGQHQFASDGLLLMIVGGLGVYLRAIPERLWAWFVGQTTMTITVKDDDAAYVWVKEWFLEQKFLSRVRRVDLDTTLQREQLALIPAQGDHWFWHSGRPFRVELFRSEDTRGWSAKRTEWLTFTTIGRRQMFLKKFVAGIVECHRKNVALISSLYLRDDYWEKVEGYSPRLLESVILKPGEKERLVQDIEKFKAAKQRYSQLGVPYHRGYLFYGPPGTGKTSLISGLAANFGMSIYAVSLTDFNDKTLMKAIRDVPPNSVILFEDIDCMKPGKARQDPEEWAGKQMQARPGEAPDPMDRFGVTLSGLLNVLDGFNAPENVLFIMTTNKIETLDQALLRPGRIDYRLFLGKAAEEQKVELYLRFFPRASPTEAEEFVAANRSAETMAEFQGLLLGLDQERPEDLADREFLDVIREE